MSDNFELIAGLEQQTRRIARELPDQSFDLVDTSRGLQAIVDAEFAQTIRRYRWYAVFSRGDHAYAVADIQGRRVSMQRLVISLKEGRPDLETVKHVSFVNKHSFDCRYENLIKKEGRQAVMRNRLRKRTSASQFKGVRKFENPSGGVTWRAQIKSDVGRIDLGRFESEREAAQAYDFAATQLFDGGEHLNLPDEPADPITQLGVWERIARAMRSKAGSA